MPQRQTNRNIQRHKQFSVELEKQALIFSAAHFITFGDNICEAIHGHNYRVRCHVTGPLNSHGYVVDFIALRDALQSLTRELDHKVLLPAHHATIHVNRQGSAQVEVIFGERTWNFPTGDCQILPIDNTTAERLAEYLGDQLIERFPAIVEPLETIVIGVDENEGQWGNCSWTLRPHL